jgi:hypothetical protein
MPSPKDSREVALDEAARAAVEKLAGDITIWLGDDLLRRAGLESAPQEFWGPEANVREAAWLKGRDDTVAFVQDDLEGCIRRALEEADLTPLLALEEECEGCDDTGIYREGGEWAPCSECDRGREFAECLKTSRDELRSSLALGVRERLEELERFGLRDDAEHPGFSEVGPVPGGSFIRREQVFGALTPAPSESATASAFRSVLEDVAENSGDPSAADEAQSVLARHPAPSEPEEGK